MRLLCHRPRAHKDRNAFLKFVAPVHKGPTQCLVTSKISCGSVVSNPLVGSETSWLRLALRTRTNRKRGSSKSQKVNLPACRSCLLAGIVPEPLVSFKLSLVVSWHLIDSGPGSVLTNCNQTRIYFYNSFSRWDRVFPEVTIYYLKTKG